MAVAAENVSLFSNESSLQDGTAVASTVDVTWM